MAGRVIELRRAARAAAGEGPEGQPGAPVFQGDRLAVRRVEVAPGKRLRFETAEGEEQVWFAVSGSGRYRPDPMGDSGKAEPFRVGEAAILRTGEWLEVESDGDAPLVLAAVTAPQPSVRR